MKTVPVYQRLMAKKSFRYLLVGGGVYLFELAVIIVAQRLGFTANQSVALSFIFGLIVSFILQKLFTFGDKRMHHRVVATQIIAVSLLVLFNFSFTIFLTDRLQSTLEPTITRTIALLLTTIWNFYLYKTRIFNSRMNNKIHTERPSLLVTDLKKRVIPVILKNEDVADDHAAEIFNNDAVQLRAQMKRSFLVVILAMAIIIVLMFGSQIANLVKPKQNHRFNVAMQKTARPSPPRPAAISVDGVSSDGCVGKTILQIIAHPDDDLLFINPDITNSLSKGMCIRTAYLTAGDHGWGRNYANEREQGIRAAYTAMLGGSIDWQTHGTMLSGDETVTVDKPIADNRVELYYFRLPDGGLDGAGFPLTGGNSMHQLLTDEQKVLVAIDESGRYNHATLIEALMKLVAVYQPTEIRTLSGSDKDDDDHNDHKVAGILTTEALKQYRVDSGDEGVIRLRRYIGYPIAGLKSNIAPNEQQAKESAFFAYAQYDRDVCKSMSECSTGDSSYARYISRKYEAKTPRP